MTEFYLTLNQTSPHMYDYIYCEIQ